MAIFNIPNEEATLNRVLIDNKSKKSNDLHLKLVITEEGKILKKSGPHVRDFYTKKHKQFINNQSFMLLKDQIDTIIKKMPKFIKLPTKNGTPTGTELRSLSFYLVERLKF
ncbi:hypothetical protein [Aquimarina sp. RZ0]|uniref:hypothetical protein n=1 Tax=Aquimarina sp. RZ0 TaxID=2607730 RepID=UPI0011F13A91|nr:hypothetical protein [Aquimarina sp. RZ0]KAA1245399.1 hypothetical protein F0000_12110 [Aquimarina sp. RZ0]